MARLRINLLGGFSARFDGERLDDWGSSKAEEFLCYLLLNRDRPQTREMLAAALWENATTTQSKAYLRKALWQVQSVFKSKPDLSALHILLVTPESIHRNPDVDLWVDVDAFEEAYRCAEAVSGEELDGDQVDKLREAVELYAGDLLENLYQDWCLYERERLQHLFFSMVDKLAAYYEARGNHDLARSYAERILYHDRAREYTHRQLMRLRYASGDRTGAIRQYESCVRALREDLDLEPSGATVRLYEQIRTDRLTDLKTQPIAGSMSPYDMISQLRAALNHFAEVQERISRDLSILEEHVSQVKR